MKIIFYEKGADLDAWLGGLRRELPDADLRVWEPGDTAPADYAIVWRAPRELFANRPDLQAVFNLGAGVDAILDVERNEPGTLPPNAKLVRLEDTGMAQQMVEYATYCVLRYLRRFDEYDALQRAGRWEKLPQHARESFTVGVLGLGVLGGAVNGGRYYGTPPVVANDGPDDVGQGRLLPSTSVDQYAATMGKWLGISDSDLLTVLPNLANWDASQRNLGFV